MANAALPLHQTLVSLVLRLDKGNNHASLLAAANTLTKTFRVMFPDSKTAESLAMQSEENYRSCHTVSQYGADLYCRT